MILVAIPADPSTHHMPGQRLTVQTTNGGEITGLLVRPLSFAAIHHRLGAENADLAYEANGQILPARINASRIAGVTVHYRTKGAA